MKTYCTVCNEFCNYCKCDIKKPAHVLMKPKLFIDGDKWCALYGDNLQDGVSGFGESPKEAMENFDLAWCKKLTINSAW